ncbi:MAG: AMP-binding protein [Acidimicrobiales bacterium]
MPDPVIHTSRYLEPAIPELDLVSYVLQDAGRWPGHPALVDGLTGQAVSYAELAASVGRAADRLATWGVGPGSVIALSAANGPAWVIAFYGALQAGAAVVPLNPTLTAGEVGALVAAAGVSLVITDDAALPAVSAAAEAVSGRDVALVPLATVAGATIEAPPAPHRPPHGHRDPLRRPHSGATAVIAFSSGTTGLPKGVRLTHRNLVAVLAQHEGIYHVDRRDVVLATLPMFHIYGLSIVLGYALRHGATVVTMARFALDRYLELVAQYRVTWLHLVPPLVLALVSPAAAGADVSSVRHAVSGAAPLDAALIERVQAVLGCSLGQGYGMTEASPGITWVPDDGSGRCPPGSVGLLVAGTEARVVDPETGADTPGPGEMWVRGPQVMAGYLDDPEATAATLHEGWLRTGDIVRVGADGVWWVVDRLKELIKYRGWQVAPAELEAALLAHPSVEDAAVAGIPDPEAGELPVAWVVRRAPVGDTELVDWVAERVAPYKKVRRIHFVDRIPRSPSGKVLRRVLVGQAPIGT